MSTSTAKNVVNPKSYPRFNGKHYKKWVNEMIPLLNMVDLVNIMLGTLVTPTPVRTRPSIPTGTPATGTTVAVPPTADDWSMYNALLKQYEWYERDNEKYLKKRGEAYGVLNQALDIGIWEQVKGMEPAAAWTWLRTNFAVQQFVEILEDFNVLKFFKLDLSDPAPNSALTISASLLLQLQAILLLSLSSPILWLPSSFFPLFHSPQTHCTTLSTLV